MPISVEPVGASASAGMATYNVEVDYWGPENWLTFRGDQRPTVGAVMGPRYRRQGHESDALCTVVAARYEPDHDWGDGGKMGRTQLGLVTGDVTAELGHQVAYDIAGADDVPLQHVVLTAFRPIHDGTGV
jgi:hypothetical protein